MVLWEGPNHRVLMSFICIAGYDLLLKIEYKGRTLWDCSGTNPPNPSHNPACTIIPPGGLQGKLHLQVGTTIS